MTGEIGVIGIGRMGLGIAERLLDMGERIVVWNRSPAKAAPLVARGATMASSTAEVGERCKLVIVVVKDDAAMKDVYWGPDGLLTLDLTGRVVVDLTTTTARAHGKAAKAIAEAGGAYLDAPVSGSVGPARNGQLLFMVGGDTAALEQARPVLDKLARKIVHAGPTGSGIAMKLTLNMPLVVYWQSLGEALSLAQAHGLDFEAMLMQIADSKAAIGTLPSKLGIILGSGVVEYDLAGLHKDLLAMRDTARDAGLDLPAMSAAADAAGMAVAAGWGDRDLAQVVPFIANGGKKES